MVERLNVQPNEQKPISMLQSNEIGEALWNAARNGLVNP
jgi:hypothetical protein